MFAYEVDKLAQQLADVQAALAAGEEVILTQAGEPFAKLSKIAHPPQGRIPGSAAGLIWMSDDFDEPIDDLFDVMK